MHELRRVHLELRELEALRLCDLEGLDQQGAGLAMGVSRGTVQRLLASARAKVTRALVHNEALFIGEGEQHEDPHSGRRGKERLRGSRVLRKGG